MHENDLTKCEILCKDFRGENFSDIYPLKLSGSDRHYYRVSYSDETYIVCVSSNVQENNTYLSLNKYLISKGIRVPSIYLISKDRQAYITEDLGEVDLFHVLQKKQEFPEYFSLVRDSVAQLVDFQQLNKNEWDEIVEFSPFAKDLIIHDFKYSEDNFISLKYPGYNKAKLWDDLIKLQNKLLSYPVECWGLMYRDFQSRNIMLHPEPYFIDFQSSRFGPGIYDIVSFAWQAKAGFADQERNEIIKVYTSCMESHGIFARDIITGNIPYWAAFRIIQTLGAYGLRGLKEGKPHFISSIKPAIENFNNLILNYRLYDEFPELSRIIQYIGQLLKPEDFNNIETHI